MTPPTINLSSVVTRTTQRPQTGDPLPRKRLLEPHKDEEGNVVPNEYVCCIDWSSIESFTTCDRSAMWKLVYGRIGRRGSALTFGSAIHKGLEMFYEQMADTKHYGDKVMFNQAVSQAVNDIFLAEPVDALEWRTPELCLSQLYKYFTKHETDDSHWRILHTEQAFRLPLCSVDVDAWSAFHQDLLLVDTPGTRSTITNLPHDDPDAKFLIKRIHFLWTGVIDLIINETNQTWIVDHKTTSVEGESLWKSYELSQQFQGYLWSSRELGINPAGIIANVIYSRPPAKSESAQKAQASKAFLRQRYFARGDRIDEWKVNMCNILQDFTHHLVTGAFPMKTQWCTGKFGTCPYHDVCSLPPESRFTMLNTSQYEDNNWSPLNKV